MVTVVQSRINWLIHSAVHYMNQSRSAVTVSRSLITLLDDRGNPRLTSLTEHQTGIQTDKIATAHIKLVCYASWCNKYIYTDNSKIKLPNPNNSLFNRVRKILVSGYWVLGNIHRYWVVLLLGDIFGCSDTQYNTNQRAVSTFHMPVLSEWLFSSAFDMYSDRRNLLSGHHADMLLFIKHNDCHHHRVWGFFVVIAMLYTSIGIGYWYR